MSRQERRKIEREKEKLQKRVNKLDKNTLELVDKLAEQRLDTYVKLFKEYLSEATFEAMRENRVGEDRAYKIMNRINEIMIESTEERKVS